ncbi:alpha/beta hydrolase [Chryseobacterium sp. SSA4.19]|uniref:alpha/beta hydrolase n=1 Tax=Chryseobacterium sp. SSA4.19 TaxID=2919915 RepID=UPI001F4EC596|nr:alpha/beta hydrolase [Chryseobacterium sp. SSA4.19]MCJ8155633.1 alpha/beta hydrolase [Chryseobacterium sp. SSA4.19]
MKKLTHIFPILLLLLFTGCGQKTIDLNKDSSFKIGKDVSYGTESDQKMDIYTPEKLAGKNIFIIIHGGGWRGGNKSQLTFFTYSLMKKFPENIFVSINYRLASSSRFALPNQTDDIESAMAHIEKRLTFKPHYILLGNSAGGHLSMLYAYRFNRNKDIKAVVNIVGPADLNDPGFKNYDDYAFLEKHLIDPNVIKSNISLMNFGSPTYWINTTSTSTLSFYGTQDYVVPLSQKRILDSALVKNNVYHESYEFNGTHTSWENEPNSSFLIDKIDLFLKKIDKK